MLNFDEARFLRIEQGGLSHLRRLHETVAGTLRDGATNVFFVGSGGAGILMQPAVRLLQTRSTLPVFLENPAELVTVGSASLGAQSLVVIPSLSGTTAESVVALEHARACGAVVLTLTGHEGTPLSEGADHSFVNFAEDDTSCEMFYLQSLVIALAVLDHRGEIDDAAGVHAELEALPSLLVEAKRAFEPRAELIAKQWQHEPFHIFTGAGSTWPEAFYYGMCILEEMQWIRTRPVHASDFFHGTLELVEDGVSVVILTGEDATRPLCERVEAFARQYTDRVTVLDTAEVRLPGISARVRELVSPVLLATVLERVSAHLEVLRAHPLTTRRYYKRVDY
jgi:fructoselysine-6-phosphate deglycase